MSKQLAQTLKDQPKQAVISTLKQVITEIENAPVKKSPTTEAVELSPSERYVAEREFYNAVYEGGSSSPFNGVL